MQTKAKIVVYYAARLISSQFGVEFDKQDYAKLKKVNREVQST